MGFGENSLEFLGIRDNYKEFMCRRNYEMGDEFRRECLTDYRIAGGTCKGSNKNVNKVRIPFFSKKKNPRKVLSVK